MYYIPGPYRKLVQVPILKPITEDQAKTEYIIKGETPTALKGNKGYSNKEYKLGKLVNVNRSAIRDKIISNSKSFINTVSYQSLDNNLFYIN